MFVANKEFEKLTDKVEEVENKQIKCSSTTSTKLSSIETSVKTIADNVQDIPRRNRNWIFSSLGIGLLVWGSVQTYFKIDNKNTLKLTVDPLKKRVEKLEDRYEKLLDHLSLKEDSTNETTRIYSDDINSSIGELTFSPPVQKKN